MNQESGQTGGAGAVSAAQAQQLLHQVAALLRAGGVGDFSVDSPQIANANGCEATCTGGCATSCQDGCMGCKDGCGGGCQGTSKQTGIGGLEMGFEVLRDPLVMDLLAVALEHRFTYPRV